MYALLEVKQLFRDINVSFSFSQYFLGHNGNSTRINILSKIKLL